MLLRHSKKHGHSRAGLYDDYSVAIAPLVAGTIMAVFIMQRAVSTILVFLFVATPLGMARERFDCRMTGERGMSECCCLSAPGCVTEVATDPTDCCATDTAKNTCSSDGGCGSVTPLASSVSGRCCDVTAEATPPMTRQAATDPGLTFNLHVPVVLLPAAQEVSLSSAIRAMRCDSRAAGARDGPRLHLQIGVLLI